MSSDRAEQGNKADPRYKEKLSFSDMDGGHLLSSLKSIQSKVIKNRIIHGSVQMFMFSLDRIMKISGTFL